jgi:hypothetical protein
MKRRWSFWWLLVPGILLLVGVVAIHIFTSDLHITVTFTMVGIGTILLAVAALIGAIIKWREYQQRVQDLETKTDDLDNKFNGGMVEVMTKILNDEIKSGNFRIDLVKRIATVENNLDETLERLRDAEADRERCLEREREWLRIRNRMVNALDELGYGRDEPREET